MKLEWKDSYKVGDATIDAEHVLAFKLANQFIAATDQSEQTAVAMQLYKHTREHFTHEESLMHQVHFPGVKAHTEGHNLLIARLNVISKSIAQGDVNKQALIALMNDWAMLHIVKDDAQLAAHLAKP
jgi:hemerythrin